MEVPVQATASFTVWQPMFGQAFGEALGVAIGTAFLFIIVFGLFLLGCIGATALLVVLYGLRIATDATVAGILVALVTGVLLASVQPDSRVVLAGLGFGFLVGVGVGYSKSGRQCRSKLFETRGYSVVLVGVSLLGIASGLIFWVFLLSVVGTAVVESLMANRAGAIALVVLTLTPVAVGTHVVRRVAGFERPLHHASMK